MNTTTDTATATRLRSLLLQLARHQDDLASDEAAATPYWEPQPPSVLGHRSAADALRSQADLLLDAFGHGNVVQLMGRAS
jgi:hypothetical protein